MLERTVGLEIEEAYEQLKALLIGKGCRIVAAESLLFISVQQGSLWGVSPRTAKKLVNYQLASVDSGTRIKCSSSLAPDWKNLTIIGTALAVIVASACGWIAMDLDAFLVTASQASAWSWLVTVGGYVDFQTGHVLTSLTFMLAVFLAIIIAVEVVIAVYVRFRINSFAEETLNLLV